jgi:hypothetical protein
MMFRPARYNVLTGVPAATLQQWLTSAQAALAALNSGAKVVQAAYGDKNVSYTQANLAQLQAWIYQLQRQLGIVPPRRAIMPYFR